MSSLQRQRDYARDVLRRRAELPDEPIAWGRAFGLTPAESTKLVGDERRQRELQFSI